MSRLLTTEKELGDATSVLLRLTVIVAAFAPASSRTEEGETVIDSVSTSVTWRKSLLMEFPFKDKSNVTVCVPSSRVSSIMSIGNVISVWPAGIVTELPPESAGTTTSVLSSNVRLTTRAVPIGNASLRIVMDAPPFPAVSATVDGEIVIEAGIRSRAARLRFNLAPVDTRPTSAGMTSAP